MAEEQKDVRKEEENREEEVQSRSTISLTSFATIVSGIKLKPLTGKTEDYSGVNGIQQIGEQIKYSKQLLKISYEGQPNFDSIFSGE